MRRHHLQRRGSVGADHLQAGRCRGRTRTPIKRSTTASSSLMSRLYAGGRLAVAATRRDRHAGGRGSALLNSSAMSSMYAATVDLNEASRRLNQARRSRLEGVERRPGSGPTVRVARWTALSETSAASGLRGSSSGAPCIRRRWSQRLVKECPGRGVTTGPIRSGRRNPTLNPLTLGTRFAFPFAREWIGFSPWLTIRAVEVDICDVATAELAMVSRTSLACRATGLAGGLARRERHHCARSGQHCLYASARI